jgi:hypothetical protein
MMDTEHEYLVAGVFESQQQADATVARLHRIGVPDSSVEIGEPEPGRYRIERHESAEFWTAVRRGMLIGAAIGIAASLGIMWFAMPGLRLANLIELSVPMGAAWGLFVGGLSGVAAKSVTLVEGEPRYAATADGSDVLVVVHASDRFGTAHEVMKRQHPRHLLIDVPAIHHPQPHLTATA